MSCQFVCVSVWWLRPQQLHGCPVHGDDSHGPVHTCSGRTLHFEQRRIAPSWPQWLQFTTDLPASAHHGVVCRCDESACNRAGPCACVHTGSGALCACWSVLCVLCATKESTSCGLVPRAVPCPIMAYTRLTSNKRALARTGAGAHCNETRSACMHQWHERPRTHPSHSQPGRQCSVERG